MLTSGGWSGILSERLARGHENLIKIVRNRVERRMASRKRLEKKCLTIASVRDKLNKFEPRGLNEFKKD